MPEHPDDHTIIEAKWRVPIKYLYSLRSRVQGYAENMSAEEDPHDHEKAIVTVEINRAAARNLSLPDWAERL